MEKYREDSSIPLPDSNASLDNSHFSQRNLLRVAPFIGIMYLFSIAAGYCGIYFPPSPGSRETVYKNGIEYSLSEQGAKRTIGETILQLKQETDSSAEPDKVSNAINAFLDSSRHLVAADPDPNESLVIYATQRPYPLLSAIERQIHKPRLPQETTYAVMEKTLPAHNKTFFLIFLQTGESTVKVDIIPEDVLVDAAIWNDIYLGKNFEPWAKRVLEAKSIKTVEIPKS